MQTEARDYQLSLEGEVEEERRQAEHQVRLLGRSNEADIQEVRVAVWQSSAAVRVRVSERLSSLTVTQAFATLVDSRCGCVLWSIASFLLEIPFFLRNHQSILCRFIVAPPRSVAIVFPRSHNGRRPESSPHTRTTFPLVNQHGRVLLFLPHKH